MRMKRLALLGILAVAAGLAPRPASAQIYAWRDAEGHLVLSDRPSGTGVSYAGPSTGAIRTTRPVARSAATRYDGLIEQHAGAQGVDPELVRAVIQVESGFDARAVSPKGAMGLMQLMPATATAYRVTDPFDPAENIRGGVAYLRRLLDRYSNRVELALAAYNAGPGAVDRHGEQVPPYKETRDYVRRITSVTAIPIGPRRVIYKIVEIIDGREVPRYSDRRPAGDYRVVTRR
jgi:soluble lytic murein transglycosylase-like protein